MRKIYLLIFLCSVVTNSNIFAATDKKLLGFLWYNEKILKEKLEQKKLLKSVKKSPTKKLSNLEKLKLKFEKALNLAIDQPTTINVVKAQRLQKEIMDKSLKFAEIWQYVALLDPTLSSIRNHPNVLQRKFNQQIVDIENKVKISSLSKNWGLILQVKENCPHCYKFAEIVKDFAKKYKLQLIAVSPKGLSYEGISGVIDSGKLDFINPKGEVPVLYLISANSREIFPIARGINNSDQIIQNINNINKHFRKLFNTGGSNAGS